MKLPPMIDYFKWLATQFNELTQNAHNSNYYYKIVDKEFCKKTNSEKLIIQISGKNAFISLTPQELVQEESLLRGFSPLDVRTITFLAFNESKPIQPKKTLYKILSQFFSNSMNKEMFTIKCEDSSQLITKSSQEISSDPAFIRNLDPEDAHRVGYISGSENILDENILFQKKRVLDDKDKY